MSKPLTKHRTRLTLFQLLPNLMTVTAVCAGLTSIRFGIHGRYEPAVLLILLASLLDGLDGRLARILQANSDMGAELDSLADFLNFGVAPPLLIYFWALQDMKSGGWIAVLIFAVCTLLRLARFNVANKCETTHDSGHFIGVPAPAGALLVLLPMFISFAISGSPVPPNGLITGYMVLIGLLLISPFKTPSLKQVTFAREQVGYFLVAFAFLGAAVMTYPWVTLSIGCLFYILFLVWITIHPLPSPGADTNGS